MSKDHSEVVDRHGNLERPNRIDLTEYQQILQKVFKFSDFRLEQRQVLEAVQRGGDCLAVLPTGSGKSLCYVIPALVSPGLTVVISPLIALMRDQVQRFVQLGVACAALESGQNDDERSEVWDAIASGQVKLLYVSPERLAQTSFRTRLRELVTLKLIAIDEAHCVSQWGHQFRPDYRKIGENLREFGAVQKIALTATATAEVRNDIIEALSLEQPQIIYANPVRANLRMRMFKCPTVASQLTNVLTMVNETSGQGIVYAPTRRMVEQITEILRNDGIEAGAYHAGLYPEQRRLSQGAFLRGQTRVMVATNAFGMGIDIRALRFVFHVGLPPSIEAYVQEIGRAGRDGLPARCYLFYSGRDVHVQRFLVEKSFPEADCLRSILQRQDTLFPENLWVEADSLYKQISQADKHEYAAVRDAFKFLCKDGYVSSKFLSDGPMDVEYLRRDLLIENVDELLSNLDLRRSKQLDKLQAMSDLAGLGEGQEGFLKAYFAI